MPNFARLGQIKAVVIDAGEWLHRGCVDDAVEAWNETGLPVDEIKEWIEIGCFSAQHAFWMANVNVRPCDASVGWGGKTVAYLYASGQCQLSDVVFHASNYEGM